MLTTYLNNQPYSRFVFIEDSLTLPGKALLKYIINSHTKSPSCKIHYFVFEGNFERTKKRLAYPNIECYDFVSDSNGWLSTDGNQDFAAKVLEITKSGSVIVIDSLSHAIFQCGIATMYKTIRQLLTNTSIARVVTILHQDLCGDNTEISRYFQHISTLAVILEPKFNSNNGRVSYIYRKPGGKIIRMIEEYKFENGILKTEPLKTIDLKTMVREGLSQVLPENLSTFKISLNEQEKESRDKLVLPYLPKESVQDEEEEAKIFYQFDHVDDWDEEDPDDDLDI